MFQGTVFPWYLLMTITCLFSSSGASLPHSPSAAGMASLTIITQPVSRIECEDHVVNFKVVISGGTDPVTFTWQRKLPAESGFTDIPEGAPGISYPTPGTIRVSNVGSYANPGGTRYRVVVSDVNGSVTSEEALLTVNEITDVIPSVAFPALTNVILCEGANITYTVTTSGTPPVSYQWKKYLSPGVWTNLSDNGTYSGTKTAVLSITNATPSESGYYKVNITFHSSWTDCSIDSETRTRKLTIQGNLLPPEITNAEPVCTGFPPPLLTAAPAGGGSGTFQYQWQSSPDMITWSELPGATTLSYQVPAPIIPLWYRVNAADKGIVSCGSVTGIPGQVSVVDCSAYHYRTKQSGSWQNRSIWETSPDGITWGGTAYTFPTSGMKSIRIRDPHLITVNQDIAVDEVTLDPGGMVTVMPGKTLTNAGNSDDFSICSSAAKSGSLLVNGHFDGPLQYRLYASPHRWTIISPPVRVQSGFTTNVSTIRFNATTSDYDFAGYLEAHNEGWQYCAALPEKLTSGKGYVTRTAANATPQEGIIVFSGTLNGMVNDTVSPMVYDTGTRNGWNAVGNPFTTAIGATAGAVSAENFLTRNAGIFEDTYGAVYVWNQTGAYDGSQQYYRAIGNSGYNFADFGYYSGENPDYLQVGQGFLINVREDAHAVFSRQMQVHQPEVRMKSAASWPGLILCAEAGGMVRRTVVAFHESMTTGLDKTFDVGLLSSGAFNLYTRLLAGDSGAELEIQCLPDHQYGDLVIPVGLDIQESGTVTLRVAGVLLPAGWFPVLEDRLLRQSMPLMSDGDFYRVELAAGTMGTGRLWLRFGRTLEPGLKENPSGFLVWTAEGRIRVTAHAGTFGRVMLYDLQGRLLESARLSEGNTLEFSRKERVPGVYVLRMESDQGVKVVKFMGR